MIVQHVNSQQPEPQERNWPLQIRCPQPPNSTKELPLPHLEGIVVSSTMPALSFNNPYHVGDFSKNTPCLIVAGVGGFAFYGGWGGYRNYTREAVFWAEKASPWCNRPWNLTASCSFTVGAAPEPFSSYSRPLAADCLSFPSCPVFYNYASLYLLGYWEVFITQRIPSHSDKGKQIWDTSLPVAAALAFLLRVFFYVMCEAAFGSGSLWVAGDRYALL